jgi:hypothetical protein
VNSPTRFNQTGRLGGPGGTRFLCLLGCAALAAVVHGANPPARSNTAPSEPVVLKSVFVMPTGPQEGKDPFFPRSLRPYESVIVRTNMPLAVAPTMIDLKLSGISGTAERPLAIINGKTFEQGEEGEVRVGVAHMNIRVVEIKANTVTVQMGTQQQVLRMRGNF